MYFNNMEKRYHRKSTLKIGFDPRLILQLRVKRKDDNESDDQSNYQNYQHFPPEFLLMTCSLLKLTDSAFNVLGHM